MKKESNVKFCVWGSEDEGFRYPLEGGVFATLKEAEAFAKAHGACHKMDVKSQIRLKQLEPPLSHGEVVAVYSSEDDVTSFKEALKCLHSGSPENLYALDWIFIMKVFPLVI